MRGVMKGIGHTLGLGRARPPRPRLHIDMSETVVYAVGDVHGCLDALLSLEREIVEDAKALPGDKLILMLGDYVDRGPRSAQVLDHLSGPAPDGFSRICLAGNHEFAMLDYLEGRIGLRSWLSLGAEATLFSYGIDHGHLMELYRDERQVDALIREAVPARHLDFLRSLPVLVEAGMYVFVHAGIRPGVDLDRQREDDLVSIRSAFLENSHLLDRYVVHGHTPVAEAGREGMRVNLDTGAVFGGRLTGLRIWQDKGLYLTG